MDTTTAPGYLIVIGTGVAPGSMIAYGRVAMPIMLRHGGRLLLATGEGETEVIEGGPFLGSIRVFEFPSRQHARDFYYSPEYQQEALPLRVGKGKIDVILADGFVLDAKWLQGKTAADETEFD